MQESKTEHKPCVGGDGEPIAELTRLGWFIMSPGQEFNRKQMLLTQARHIDYEEFFRLDVLALADTPEHDQGAVYTEFKEQLVRSEEGWYETGLPWRGDIHHYHITRNTCTQQPLTQGNDLRM